MTSSSKTLRISDFLSALLILICAPLASASSSFSVEVDYCSGSADVPFTILDASIYCENGCSWGSSAEVSGVFEIQDGLPTQYPNITVKAWARTIYSGTLSLCDGDLTSIAQGENNETATCPDAGVYEFSTYATLPEPKAWKFTSSLYISISTLFDFVDEEVVCSFSVISSNSFTDRFTNNNKKKKKNNNSRNYSNRNYIASGAVLAAGLAYGVRRRRRRIAAQDDCDDIHTNVMSRFDLMSNSKATP